MDTSRWLWLDIWYALIPALESVCGSGGIKREGLQTCDPCSSSVKLQLTTDEAQPVAVTRQNREHQNWDQLTETFTNTCYKTKGTQNVLKCTIFRECVGRKVDLPVHTDIGSWGMI